MLLFSVVSVYLQPVMVLGILVCLPNVIEIWDIIADLIGLFDGLNKMNSKNHVGCILGDTWKEDKNSIMLFLAFLCTIYTF